MDVSEECACGAAQGEAACRWSDGEEEEEEECGLLQEMIEEDEEIDLHNAETFGLDDVPRGQAAAVGGGAGARAVRRRLDRGLLEDPAVLKSVTARPSLKSIDSAIVDCSVSADWEEAEPKWAVPSVRSSRSSASAVLQDQAVVGVVDRPGRGLAFSPCRGPSFPRPFSQRCRYQMSPVSAPFRPQQYSRMPRTPNLLQLRFGTDLPRPAPLYSPSSNILQNFSAPGPVVQLHPQHKRLLNQRQQKPNRKSLCWDPYSQLMSEKEKEWIIRLQMIQLQSEKPHLDDYYYQEFYRRLEVKLAEEEILGSRQKKEPPKLTTPYVTKTDSYVPVVHIEGSLGQVTVSTCFSPRRAIDAVPAHGVDEEHKDTRQQRLVSLSNIEKLYVLLLEVEEERRPSEAVHQRLEEIYSALRRPCGPDPGDDFLSPLLIAKGKRLVARLLPFLSQERGVELLSAVTRHLPVLMGRDAEEVLPVLYPPLRGVIARLSFSQLTRVLREFTTPLPDAHDSRLTLACQNKFGLSLLYALLSQGELLLSSDLPIQPSIGDFESWTDTVFHVARQLSQTMLVEPLLLPSNLLTLFCRYLDKKTVHQLRSNMESSTGFLAVAS